MMPVSIVKIVASASVLVTACGAALVFGIARLQHEEKLERAPVAATTIPSPVASDAGNERSSAVAVTAAKAAALATELSGPPGTLAKDQSVPSFDVARTEATGEAVIAGRAAPGATVELLRGGERVDRAVADASGQFVMVPPQLPAGSYELTLSARSPDGTIASSKEGVKVTINRVEASSSATQSRAEEVSQTAALALAPPKLPSRAAAAKPEIAVLQPPRTTAVSTARDEGLSSPAAVPRITTKVVSRGDSLWRISRIAYGDGARYAVVYRANRDRIRDPDLIHPGQVLSLPLKGH